MRVHYSARTCCPLKGEQSLAVNRCKALSAVQAKENWTGERSFEIKFFDTKHFSVDRTMIGGRDQVIILSEITINL